MWSVMRRARPICAGGGVTVVGSVEEDDGSGGEERA